MNQPFIGHVHELRRRLTWSALVVLAGSCLAYLWRSAILQWLEAPLHQTLYYNKVTGAFEFIVQACLIAGLMLGAPMIIYQLIAFVQPALSKPLSRRLIATIITSAFALMIAGLLFGYYISLPAALHFLGTIDSSHLHPLIAADSYLTFVMIYLGVFALVFLLPLAFIIVDNITPLPPAGLAKARKWVIIGAFAAALILPVAPDPVSQILLALPIIVFYEISIWLIKATAWRRRRRARPLTAAEPHAQPEPVIMQPTPAKIVQTRRPQRAHLRPAVIDLRGR